HPLRLVFRRRQKVDALQEAEPRGGHRRGTGLYELWKTGRYRNYPPEQLVDIIARILAMVRPWTHVYRVQRDIPMPLVTSGVEKGNLRELALAQMEDLGLKCRDVRTREVGIQVIVQS
ncbi:hypothetical protein VIGAN_11111000, partial [Vigna angularis var. angularis]